MILYAYGVKLIWGRDLTIVIPLQMELSRDCRNAETVERKTNCDGKQGIN